MLLRVQVANYRSILDPVEISMIAVDGDRSATRGFDLLPERVLTVAGIYGPNASGKSNLLEAIAWLGAAVRQSLRGWQDFVPRDPHRFRSGPNTPSSFEVDFVVEGVRHWYRVEMDSTAILHEILQSFPERKSRTLFEREGSEVRFRRGLSRAKGIRQLLTPTTLVLSAGVRLSDPHLMYAGQAIANMHPLGIRSRPGLRPFPSPHSTYRLFLQPGGNHDASGVLHRCKQSHSPGSASLRRPVDQSGGDGREGERSPYPRWRPPHIHSRCQRRLGSL